MGLMRRDLSTHMHRHNSHRVRKQPGTVLPSGVPAVLFKFPQMYGYENLLQPTPLMDIDYLQQHTTRVNDVCDPHVLQRIEAAMNGVIFKPIRTRQDALHLYCFIRQRLNIQ